jgi:hypothetical protein
MGIGMDDFQKRYWQLREEGKQVHWSKIRDFRLLETHPTLCFMIYDEQSVFWNGHDGEFEEAMKIKSCKDTFCEKCGKG